MRDDAARITARNLVAVWPSLFVVSMGLMAVIPTLPLYLRDRFGITDEREIAWWAAVVYGAAPFTAALAGPFWGALADRVGRKAMVLRSQIAIAVVMLLMPLAPTLWGLVGLRVLQGAFAGFIAPAMALVSSTAPRGREGRVIARLQVALALGLALGPPVGAELAMAFGRAGSFRVSAVLALLAAVLVAVLAREDRSALLGAQARAAHGPLRDMRRVLALPGLLVLLGLLWLQRVGSHMAEPFVALWVGELGPLFWLLPEGGGAGVSAAAFGAATERTVGLSFAILALGSMLCAGWWGRASDRYGPLRCLALASALLAVSFGCQAAVHSTAGFLAWRGVAAVAMAGSMTLAYAAVGRRVEVARRGLAFAYVQSCIQLGLALGPQIGAVALSAGGMPTLFLCAAGFLGVAAVGMLWFRARHPGSRSEVAPPEPVAPS